MSKIGDFFNKTFLDQEPFNGEEEDVEEERAETPKESSFRTRERDNGGMHVTINNAQPKIEFRFYKPTSRKEAKTIGTDINEEKTVVLILEDLDSDDYCRLMDFLYGVAYANGATVKNATSTVSLIVPKYVVCSGVDVMEELEASGFSFR